MTTQGLLLGDKRAWAKQCIKSWHYTKSVPSGKSYYLVSHKVFIVWSIPANGNIAKFLLGYPGEVWELSRLWAADNHDPNALTQAISYAVKWIKKQEKPDILVSYADPNVGHHGGVYRAASWIYHGQSEESRLYVDAEGKIYSRRKFHSGKKSLTKAEIESKGFTQTKAQGKHRYIKPISRKAKRVYLGGIRPAPPSEEKECWK